MKEEDAGEGLRGSDKGCLNCSKMSNERWNLKVEQNIYLKMSWVSGLTSCVLLWIVNSAKAFYDVFTLKD